MEAQTITLIVGFAGVIATLSLGFASNSRRFDDVNKRFDDITIGVNRRFDDVNKRFDDVNKRFDDVNKRLDIMDRRSDTLAAVVMDNRDMIMMICGRLGIGFDKRQRPTDEHQTTASPTATPSAVDDPSDVTTPQSSA